MLSVVLAQHDGRCDDLQQGDERSPPQEATRAPRIALVRKTTRESGFFAWPDGRCGTALRVRAGAIQSRGKDSARILAFDAAITPS